ncbi:MAG TPA: DNA polymerase III subunit chi [Steroidobacteraceae bacterium]
MADTSVKFYLHASAEPRARLTTACRLAEKACEQGLKVAVRTSSPGETAAIDDLLWTFADRSFVPHGVWPAEPAVAQATPVLIGSSALPDTHRDVLINLAADAPAEVSGYARICEVVGGDEDSKQRARLRWRTYRGLGCEPEKIDV